MITDELSPQLIMQQVNLLWKLWMIFLIEEIFMHYDSLKELLSDNSMNLKAQVVEYYLQKLITRH